MGFRISWATFALNLAWETRTALSRSSMPLIVSAMPSNSESACVTSIRSSKCPWVMRRAVSEIRLSGFMICDSMAHKTIAIGNHDSVSVQV